MGSVFTKTNSATIHIDIPEEITTCPENGLDQDPIDIISVTPVRPIQPIKYMEYTKDVEDYVYDQMERASDKTPSRRVHMTARQYDRRLVKKSQYQRMNRARVAKNEVGQTFYSVL